MSHPYEQLADLLDGTLDADARARVDAHLATCAACREDLRAAAAGRDAARALPAAEPPAGLRDRIVQAAGRGDAGASGAPRWHRWAGVAAAAALVAVVALSLPEVGGDGPSDDGAGAPAAPEAALDAATADLPAVEVSDRNFEQGDLTALAEDPDSFRFVTAAPAASGVQDARPDAAARCVRRAFADQPTGALIRLIRARFEGRDAYLAVYLEGPGAGEEPDTAVVWVAAAEGCSVLSFAQARL